MRYVGSPGAMLSAGTRVKPGSLSPLLVVPSLFLGPQNLKYSLSCSDLEAMNPSDREREREKAATDESSSARWYTPQQQSPPESTPVNDYYVAPVSSSNTYMASGGGG